MDEKIVGLMALSKVNTDVKDFATNFKVAEYDDLFIETSGQYEINCFEIKIFFIKSEFVDRSIDFLNSSFEIFPKVPYCSIKLPFTEVEHPILAQFICIDPTDEHVKYV